MARSNETKGPNLRSSEVECDIDPVVQAPAEQPVKQLAITACGLSMTTNGGAPVAIVGGRVTMEQFAAHLSHYGFDRPVVNRTGLNGNFDVFARVTADMPAGSSEARFLLAMREQLGLTLRAELLPVDVLRIHRIERPSEN